MISHEAVHLVRRLGDAERLHDRGIFHQRDENVGYWRYHRAERLRQDDEREILTERQTDRTGRLSLTGAHRVDA